MEELFIKLEHYRIMRIIFFICDVCFFSVILLINDLLAKNKLMETFIIYNAVIVFVITIYIYYIKIDIKYDSLYHNEFLPHVIKAVNETNIYENNPATFNIGNSYTKIYSDNCDIAVNSVIHFSNCDVYETILAVHSYRTNRIVLFRGQIFVMPYTSENQEHILVLSDKRPLDYEYEEVKEMSFRHYRIYSKGNFNSENLSVVKIKEILKNLFISGYKFNISINDNIVIFKKDCKHIYHKPTFRKIDSSFFADKINDFRKLQEITEVFANCFAKK